MSLLSMCETAAEEVGLAAPTTIIGNSDASAVKLLRHAGRTGAIMAKKSWHELMKTHSFSTSAAEPQYSLPSDYRSMVPDTLWNQTTDTEIFLIGPRQWSYQKSVVTSNYYDRYRLLGDDAGPDIGAKFTIHPTPEAIETIFFQYYSKNWLTDVTGVTEYAAFQADEDLIIFDEEMFTMGIIWRLAKSLGQPYEEERTEFDRQHEICLAQSGSTGQLHADGNTATLSNIPESGFG